MLSKCPSLAQLCIQTIGYPFLERRFEGRPDFVSAYLQQCAKQTNKWLHDNCDYISLFITDKKINVHSNDIKILLLVLANILDTNKFSHFCNSLFVNFLKKNEAVSLIAAEMLVQKKEKLDNANLVLACMDGSSQLVLELVRMTVVAENEASWAEMLSTRLLMHTYFEVPVVESDLVTARLLISNVTEQEFYRGKQPLELAYLINERLKFKGEENPHVLSLIAILLSPYPYPTVSASNEAFSEEFIVEQLEAINHPANIKKPAILGETPFEKELLAEAERLLEKGQIPIVIEGLTPIEALAYQILFEKIAADQTCLHICGSQEFKEKLLNAYKKQLPTSNGRTALLSLIRLDYPILCIECRCERYTVYAPPVDGLPFLMAFNAGIGQPEPVNDDNEKI